MAPIESIELSHPTLNNPFIVVARETVLTVDQVVMLFIEQYREMILAHQSDELYNSAQKEVSYLESNFDEIFVCFFFAIIQIFFRWNKKYYCATAEYE